MSLRGWLTLRYALALGLLAALTLASYALMERMFSGEAMSVQLINETGRQRMLCQRVELLAALALAEGGELRTLQAGEMRTVLKEFMAGHELLLHGPAAALGLTPDSPALELLRAGGNPLEPAAHRFEVLAERLAGELGHAGQARPDALERRLDELVRQGDALLAHLEENMAQLKSLDERTRQNLRRLILLLSGLTMAGLVAAGLFIFRPMVEQVARSQEHLENLNRALAAQASTDTLTGALNRRAWDLEIDRELSRARRSGQPLCLLMADLDHFKRVNDTYGHQRGDAVLREFAERMRAGVRAQDLFFRLGGEEFALLLPGTDLESGLQAAQKLRSAVEAQPLDGDLHVSVSFGAAQSNGDEEPGTLVRRADQGLYAAKEHGRNRAMAGPKQA